MQAWLVMSAAMRPSNVYDEKPCAEASNPDKPWIGQWAAQNGSDLLALSITQYQVNGQLISQGGTYVIGGRVDEQPQPSLL